MSPLLASIFLLVAGLIQAVYGGVLFSTLPRSLEVSVSMNQAGDFKNSVEAGKDQLFVKWSLNSSAQAVTTDYKVVKLKLCYAPPSQLDRGWRKTNNDLHKDKTCLFDIAAQPFTAAGNSSVYTIKKEIPGALYFVRAYALNATGSQVAFGQSTSKDKTTNIFTVVPITGRPKSLYIATVVFSVFSIGSLFTLFTIEKRNAAQKKGK